ncbi:hypothetical protein BN2476_1240020 [Paraburkholderia piptadeniae]|uniref:Uncharacterized protein n=1 Tax=Paraburkholderia piptadeniae TaxID=1701573 RepID=A0A1N7SW25_9BURK|nr:hypothetical protein BN2476_1240020 [Paraburkholderia piptadeniae]
MQIAGVSKNGILAAAPACPCGARRRRWSKETEGLKRLADPAQKELLPPAFEVHVGAAKAGISWLRAFRLAPDDEEHCHGMAGGPVSAPTAPCVASCCRSGVTRPRRSASSSACFVHAPCRARSSPINYEAIRPRRSRSPSWPASNTCSSRLLHA